MPGTLDHGLRASSAEDTDGVRKARSLTSPGWPATLDLSGFNPRPGLSKIILSAGDRAEV